MNKPAGERQTKAETAPSVNPLDRISTRIENRIASRIETRIGRVPTDPVEVDDAYREAQDRVRQAGRR